MLTDTVEADSRGVGQRFVAQVDQVTRAYHLHEQEQRWALADDHGDAQHRVQHMHLHAQGDPHGSRQPGLATLCITAASDHGEVGPRADDGEDSEQGYSDEFSHWRVSIGDENAQTRRLSWAYGQRKIDL
ncbi:hypothetical protein D3C81_1652460 [compost metagenome]